MATHGHQAPFSGSESIAPWKRPFHQGGVVLARLVVGIIGVLTETGRIADAIWELLPRIDKQTGAVVLFDDDPERLVSRLVAYYQEQHYLLPSCFTDGTAPPPLTALDGDGS